MLRGILFFVMMSWPVLAQEDTIADLSPLPGWQVQLTDYDFATLVDRTRNAITANGLAVVTQAGPTGAAARRGITIPGNRIIGAFNNDFAVRLLRQSTEAMIHAPIRFYVTENASGTATLSYIRPSELLSDYIATATDPELSEIAAELDGVFAAIAEQAAAR